MRKFFKKIICVLSAAVMGASLFASAACSDVYKSKKLDGYVSDAPIYSNGGFAVQKGGFVYYINGKQSNTADNTYGKVETGAIMRISTDDLAARNYAKTETVVPEIVHSGNTDAGIFIYGDYVYYPTPSAEKNSDGEIQYSNILFKRAKLDGTETMRGYLAKYSSNSIQYRFVEVNNVVYLLYVATGEDLYGSSRTNLHSVNTETGDDTLLAYNVDSVMFDKTDLTNPRVYYTMTVKDFVLDKTYSKYNQVYTVTADATKPNEYDFTGVEDYDAEEDPLYVNCGDLVLDGIGMVDGNLNATQFNAKEIWDGSSVSALTRSPYTYTLSNYQNGTLFYTRTSTNNATAMLFAVKESDLLKEGRKPAIDSPEEYLIVDGSGASNYTYLFDDKNTLTGAFISNSNGLIKTVVDGGKLLTEVDNDKTFYLTTGGTPTILFTQGGYVYYSESGSGANGNIINRLDYSGEYKDYNQMPVEEDVNDYTPVRILDLDCTSDWYKPEMFEGQIFFSTETKNMTEYSSDTTNYSHIMVCDIRSGKSVMTNAQLDELNKKYEKVSEKIDEVDEETYENLKNAYRYAFYTGDGEYIDELIAAYVDTGEDEEKFWSKESVEKFKDFVEAKGDWADYASDKLTVNGKEEYANRHEYYYSLLGKMTEKDEEAYDSYVKSTYLKAWPEDDESWFEGLSAGAKAGFLVGVIGGGLILIAACTVVALVIVRKRKAKLPTYTKKRIKVDTTDDKSVDVYSTEDAEESKDNQ